MSDKNQKILPAIPFALTVANMETLTDKIFQKYDDNNSGVLDYIEMSKFLK